MAAGELAENRKRDRVKALAMRAMAVPLSVRTSDLPKRAASAVVMLALAGTALQDHHHFLRAAEDYRFNMVQTFNRLQMSEMTLAEDLARNDGDEAGRNTRVNSSNWAEMPVFELRPLDHTQRWGAASSSGFAMGLWLIVAFGLLLLSSRQLRS